MTSEQESILSLYREGSATRDATATDLRLAGVHPFDVDALLDKAREQARRDAFRACPILSDYIATALQDAQYREQDESCMESRDERDTGTIYSLRDETFAAMQRDCERFVRECAADIEAAQALVPGEDGLRYGRGWIDDARIGSTLWLARCGSGVTFTDDGDAPCLERMAEWARANPCEGLYFGDDGEMYLI